MPDIIRVAEVRDRAVVRLRSWSPLPRASDTVLLVPPVLGGEAQLLKLAPDELWMVSDTLDGAQLSASLRRQLEGLEIAAVDLSSALKVLRVEGSGARDLLANGCGLDLDPRNFPAGVATRTRFAQLCVTIHCTDPAGCFELYVGRSYVPWLRAWLEDAAVRFK